MTSSEMNRKAIIQPTLSTSEPNVPPGNFEKWKHRGSDQWLSGKLVLDEASIFVILLKRKR
jgi:hypothetical protein